MKIKDKEMGVIPVISLTSLRFYIPGTARTEVINCKWFMLTGMSKHRKQNRCLFNHPPGENPTTLVIKNLFTHPDLRGGLLDNETRYDVRNLWAAYCAFYTSVFEKFSIHGEITMLKCSCNVASYLQGTVFVQYVLHQSAVQAHRLHNGEMFAGKPMDIEIVSLTNWKFAVCGRSVSKTEHDEENCSLLHVFPNPNNAFSGLPGADLCKFYMASGVCNKRDTCRFDHPVSEDSCIVIVPNFFQHVYLETPKQGMRREEEVMLVADMKEAYTQFYINSMDLFKTWGRVVSCTCSQNTIPHLRGNVYIEYSTHLEAQKAVLMLAQMQIKSNICPTTAYTKCEHFLKAGRCFAFGDCKGLHLFTNPVLEGDNDNVAEIDPPPSHHNNNNNNSSEKGRQGQESHDDTYDPNKVHRGAMLNSKNSTSSRKRYTQERHGESFSSHGEATTSKTCNMNELSKSTEQSEHFRIFNESLSLLSGSQQVYDSVSSEDESDRILSELIDKVDAGDEYFVHVTMLPKRHTARQILKLFSAYGGIKEVDIPDEQGPDVKVFAAFVTFENKECAEKVMRVSHMVDGQRIRLEGFDPIDGGVANKKGKTDRRMDNNDGQMLPSVKKIAEARLESLKKTVPTYYQKGGSVKRDDRSRSRSSRRSPNKSRYKTERDPRGSNLRIERRDRGRRASQSHSHRERTPDNNRTHSSRDRSPRRSRYA